jgi:LmbE family N-acetylglucosaminyl deacetylase
MLEHAGQDLLVISPHLDDAALSCAEAIWRAPRAAVVTVFAGTPPDAAMRTDWDGRSGFASAGEAMLARCAEDAAALKMLGAEPVWLDFLDSQYGDTPGVDAVAAALEEAVRAFAPRTVLLPAGLFHSDHVLTHEAALLLRKRLPQLDWRMYEEAHYRRIAGFLQRRLAHLLQAGVQATPLPSRPDAQAAPAKESAIGCYASQLRALAARVRDGHADAFAPECFWRLEDLPVKGA